MKDYKYYTVYKTINNINGKIYIGMHATDDLNDSYIGSGHNIKAAIKKYGIENFTKTYIHIFDSPEDMIHAEAILVNEEFCKRKDVYNIAPGGQGGSLKKGMITVKDKDGNAFDVYPHDPRYLEGDVTHIQFGLKRSEETKQKMRDAWEERRQKFKPSQQGKKYAWVSNIQSQENKKIPLDTLARFINNGWVRGRDAWKEKGKRGGNGALGTKWCWVINKDLQQSKRIKHDQLNEFLDNGWIKGKKIIVDIVI